MERHTMLLVSVFIDRGQHVYLTTVDLPADL